ncbi:hypothetical protein SDC9_211955 [bioreactor metagenome]|uniref:Uncharacterized protein n=1 Tax=bioreactor metagenome TaxID=1076179 RepID=A0A645JX53_9ZZZZ
MRAAFFGIDIIDISINIFVVSVGILQCHLNDIGIFFAFDIDRFFVNCGLTAIYIIDEGNNAAFVMEYFAFVGAFITQFNFYSFIQES